MLKSALLIVSLCFVLLTFSLEFRLQNADNLETSAVASSAAYTSAITSQITGKHSRQRRTYPDWRLEDGFEFYGFWLKNEENIVRNALLGAADILEGTMKVLGGAGGEGLPSGEEDPSFKRYFRSGDLTTVGAIYQRLLAVLGAPNTSPMRQCIEASKLQLIYGDGPNSNGNCLATNRAVFAYYNSYTDGNGNVRSYVSFCKIFFDRYKLHVYQEDKPNIPYVNNVNLGATIDTAEPTRLPEVESGAAILLHELFHWSDVTKPVVANQIEDIILIRPDDKRQVRAYRSFYAMKVKDSTYQAQEPPTENADNYVYLALEIFYRYRFGRSPWQDSPDLHGEPASPNIPPAGP